MHPSTVHERVTKHMNDYFDRVSQYSTLLPNYDRPLGPSLIFLEAVIWNPKPTSQSSTHLPDLGNGVEAVPRLRRAHGLQQYPQSLRVHCQFGKHCSLMCISNAHWRPTCSTATPDESQVDQQQESSITQSSFPHDPCFCTLIYVFSVLHAKLSLTARAIPYATILVPPHKLSSVQMNPTTARVLRTRYHPPLRRADQEICHCTTQVPAYLKELLNTHVNIRPVVA